MSTTNQNDVSNLSDEARLAMGCIVAPYAHACCYASCTCSGRLARYIPGTGMETFIPSRPFSRRELRHRAAWTRRLLRACAAAPWIS